MKVYLWKVEFYLSNEYDDEEYLGRSLYNEHDDPYGSALYSSSELLQKDDSEKRHYYEERPELVKEILMEGTKKAKQKAEEQMKKVRTAMKIDY